MKKVFVLLFLFVATMGFTQQFVENINGFNWVTWDQDQRSGYVLGFYSAYSSIMIRIYDEVEITNSEEDLEFEAWIHEHFYMPIDTDVMIERVDEFYSSYSNRSFKLYQVIIMFGGKDYWN